MRITRRLSLASVGLFTALVGCSGNAVTDGPGGSLGGSGSAGGGGTAGAGSGGVGASAGTSPSAGSGGVAGHAASAGGSGTAGAAGTGGGCTENPPPTDGCNSCSCMNGQWECTAIICLKTCGGFAGNTCSASEYCAYTVGQLCGAADASSTCQPRPQGCTDIYMPVCGCDQKTYPSSCDAAMHGQGVYTVGVCPQAG
jgi:hypothetical protein